MRRRVIDLLICAILPFIASLLLIYETFDYPETFLHNDADLYAAMNRSTDMAAYMEHAHEILDGRMRKEPFYRAPLYSFFLAAVFIFSEKILAIALLQSVLFAATAFLVFETTRLFFGRGAGFLSVSLILLSGFFQFWVIIPHTAVLEAFLSSLSLYALSLLVCEFRKSDAVLAGASLAVLCLVRPNFLAVAPIVLLGIFIMKGGDGESLKKIIGNAVLSASAGFLVLSPVLLWNNIHSDSFVLLSTNGAPTWLSANSADSVVENFIYPKGGPMKFYSTEFWLHQFRKALAFCKNREYPQNVSFYVFRHFSLMLKMQVIGFGMIFASFVASAVYFFPMMRRVWHIYAFSFLFIATIVLFFVIGRFRITILPALIVPSAGFIYCFFRDLRSRKCSSRLLPPLAVATAFFLFSEPWVEADLPDYWLNTARTAFARGDIGRYRYCLAVVIDKANKNSKSAGRRILLEYAAASALLMDFKESDSILRRTEFNDRDEFVKKSADEIDALKKGGLREITRKALDGGSGGVITELIRMKMALDLQCPDKDDPASRSSCN